MNLIGAISILVEKLQALREQIGMSFQLVIPENTLKQLLPPSQLESALNGAIKLEFEGTVGSRFGPSSFGEFYSEFDGRTWRRSEESTTSFKGYVFSLRDAS